MRKLARTTLIAATMVGLSASGGQAQSVSARGRSGRTVLVDAGGSTTSHPMRGAVVVGRGASADIQIDDDFASEQHAKFVLEGSSITVEDLDSTNGTTIDGVLIEGRVEVVPGTAVILGRTRVVIT